MDGSLQRGETENKQEMECVSDDHSLGNGARGAGRAALSDKGGVEVIVREMSAFAPSDFPSLKEGAQHLTAISLFSVFIQ